MRVIEAIRNAIVIIVFSMTCCPVCGFEDDARQRQEALEKLRKEATFVGLFAFVDGALVLETTLRGNQCKIGEVLLESRSRRIAVKMGPEDRVVVIVGTKSRAGRIDHAFKVTKESSVEGDWIITGKADARREFLVEDQGNVFKFRLEEVFRAEGQ